MFINSDGVHLLMEEGEYPSPSNGDVHITITGSIGSAFGYLAYYDVGKSKIIPLVGGNLIGGKTYRLADRKPIKVYCVLDGSDIFTSINVDIDRRPIGSVGSKALIIYSPT